MTVTLSPHSEQLLKTARARGLGHSPEEIVERPLEAVIKPESSISDKEKEHRRQAVAAMLDFSRKHDLILGPDVRLKGLIHEEHKY